MDVARDLVDHQLIDRDGNPCGRIDDVIVLWTEDGAALGQMLSGGSVVLDQMGRLGRLLRPLLRFSGARRAARIDWALVGHLEPDTIHVVTPRESLGLVRTAR